MNIAYFKYSSSILGALILISCSGKSSFTGSNSQAREDQESPYQEENLEPATEVSSSAGNSCTPNQIQTQIPVSLNFVIDISTTMADEISILKNRMGAFVSAVSNAGIESISYSLTLFMDNVTYRSGRVSAQRILSDIPQIKLGGQLDNKDMPEAAFEGLMRSQQLALQAPAKNIYIVITDDTMHYGGGPNKDVSLRKCEMNTIANSIADNSMVLFWTNE